MLFKDPIALKMMSGRTSRSTPKIFFVWGPSFCNSRLDETQVGLFRFLYKNGD